MSNADAVLQRRLHRLESRFAIRELVGRYGFVVDDRDLAGIGRCFTLNGVMRSKDGVMNARGRDAVIEQFHGRFVVLGPGNHFTHDHIIRFDDADDSHAFGLVSSHAELFRNGEPMIAAMRYEDEYRIEDGEWRFADRLLGFFYYLKLAEYPRYLGELLRMRAYAEPAAADFPERTGTWREYYAAHPMMHGNSPKRD
jgi:SnoaL-like domain